MKINLAMWDRSIRFFVGTLLLAWAIAGGPWWAYTGLILIMTAAWGLCPIYSFFKIQTAKTEDRSFKSPE